MPSLLQSVVQLWTSQITLCKKSKEKHFGYTARRAWGFVGKTYTELYMQPDDDRMADGKKGPHYRLRLAKSAEYIKVMLPYIFASIPHRLVTPKRQQLPPELMQMVQGPVNEQAQANEQASAWLQTWWLNWLSGEYDLARESRTAIPEALVKGRGIVWHELERTPSGLVPASFFTTVDDLLIDADAEQLRDAAFVIRRRRRSAWRVAEEFGIPVKDLRGREQSSSQEAARDVLDDFGDEDTVAGTTNDNPRGKNGDIVTYYEVYSRAGLGQHFRGASSDMQSLAGELESLGRNIWLVIMPGVDYPLNLPPSSLPPSGTPAELAARLSWPIPYHDDYFSPWPFSPLDFYPQAEAPWATSPLEGALPLQIFLDHFYSFMMGRCRRTGRDIIVASQALEEKLKDALISGADHTVVTTTGEPGVELKKLIEILQFPPLTVDVWQIARMVERAFEQQTGMDPLLYGGAGETQMRSATEAGAREAHVSSRPDDFADCVERWHCEVARKEAFASRLYVGPELVAPLFNEPSPDPSNDPAYDPSTDESWMGELTRMWASLVNTDDPVAAGAEMTYTVAAGSARRQNKAKLQADAQMLVQTEVPTYTQYGFTTGNFGPLNALNAKLGQAFDIEIPPLPSIPPPPPEGQTNGNTP